MAKEFSSVVNETQCQLDMLFRTMMKRLENGGERADMLEQQRDELLLWQSRAQDREVCLNQTISEQGERARELEQLVAHEQARTKDGKDEHKRNSLKARQKVKKLEAKIERMKQAAAATISDERAKTRLLRDQDDTTSQSQIEIDELRAKLQAAEMEVSQGSQQIEEWKREMEHIRERYQDVDIESQQRVKKLKDQFQAERHSLHHEAGEEERRRQAVEQQLERLKKRSELKNAKQQREIALLKLEICESQDTMAEMRQDLHQKQSEIKIQSAAVIEKNDKISKLLQSIEKLKDENVRAQQEMSAQLVVAEGDTATFRDQLKTAAHELQDMRQELVAVNMAVATLSNRGGALEVIRSIGNHLSQFSQRSARSCNPNHSQYRHVTNCGTLLCSECLQQALADRCADTVLTLGSKDVFEVNCPWCRSEFWTWETLAIPYSRSWVTELKALIAAIDRFKPTLTAAETCMVVKAL
jgi:DNA repair exonuclease SbcCD ATPase subunit